MPPAVTLTVKPQKEYLDNNDAYSALSFSEGLIMTGATGTNVNDFAAVLIKPKI